MQEIDSIRQLALDYQSQLDSRLETLAASRALNHKQRRLASNDAMNSAITTRTIIAKGRMKEN